MRKTWLMAPVLMVLMLALVTFARAGGGDSSPCNAEIRDARAAVRGLSSLPPLAFVRQTLASFNHADGVCLGSYDVYDKAITSRAATWLTLMDASGKPLKSREIYVCTNGLKDQRCVGIYADDTLCGCEKWPDVQLAASGLSRVKMHPDFRARWFSARFERGSFKEYVPLKVTNGVLNTRSLKLENPQIIFALLEPRDAFSGVAPLKLVWRIRS
jgi:hypothetical protein